MKNMYHLNHRADRWPSGSVYNKPQPLGKENQNPEKAASKSAASKGSGVFYGTTTPKKDITCWSTPAILRLLWLAYTLAFLCTLRMDEVLNIQVHHIWLDIEKRCFILYLPFRKNAQTGGALEPSF